MATPQTRGDLERHLGTHLRYLRDASSQFDSGHEDEAGRMTASLRVLLAEGRTNRSLLSQLDLRSGLQVYSTAGAVELDKNVANYTGLTAFATSPGRGRVIPVLDECDSGTRQVAVDEWWDEVVFVDSRGEWFTRRDLVLSVAEKDGGVHVDPSLHDDYAGIAREGSMGLVICDNAGKRPFLPVLPAIRQVVHEVMMTFAHSEYPVLSADPSVTGYVSYCREEAPYGDVGCVFSSMVTYDTSSEERTAETPVPKVGRNEPCPCRSGKKYKRCHGRS